MKNYMQHELNMDFINSISFPNEPLISGKFLDHFCYHFWAGLLCCCTHPKMMTKIAKKCSTDQRFIRKRNTAYKIHTLVKGANHVASLIQWNETRRSISF